ncbi:MAG TPA: lipid II flippase MurJ [Candidatus Paceibacterota bacterium]|nr:lipid II flippase MurJ [Candidatus Paceibacterota bacterium]
MVQKILKILNWEVGGLHEAAFLLGVSALSSQVLALLRDRLLASTFGASRSLDIYYASFRVPDLIFISVGSFLAVTVIIPMIIQKIEDDKDNGFCNAREFLSQILTVFSLTMVVTSAVAFTLMPKLSGLITPGFDAESTKSAVLLSRILLLSPFFLGLSNLLGSVTQAFKKFFVYALSPLFYNLGIIIGIVFLYPIFGLPGLAMGVALGAFMHFAIQIPVVVKTGMFPTFSLNIDFKEIKKVSTLSFPRTLALGINQLAIMFLVAEGSFMKAGSISIFNFSYNLQSVPLAVIGVSYSVAALPEMSRIFSKKNISEFVEYIEGAFNHIIFWSLPITVLFIVLRAQIVRTILGAGMFSWNDTRLTIAALAIFALSVIAQNLIQLLDRVYYATGHTIKPVMAKIVSSILIIVLAYFFVDVFNSNNLIRSTLEFVLRVGDVEGTEILMLPLAFSLGTMFNLISLFIMFILDFDTFSKKFMTTILQVGGSSLVMGFVSYWLLGQISLLFEIDTLWEIFLQGFVAGILGICVHLIILKLIKSSEFLEIERSLRKKFWKTETVIPNPEVI